MKNLSEMFESWFNNKPVEDDILFSPSSAVSENELEQAYIDYLDTLNSKEIAKVSNCALYPNMAECKTLY